MKNFVFFLVSAAALVAKRQDLLNADELDCPGYEVSGNENGKGIKLALRDDGKVSDHCKSFGTDYPELEATVDFETPTRIHFRVHDTEHRRWVVPSNIVPRPGRHFDSGEERLYSTSITKDYFGFAVTRRTPCANQPSKLCDGPVIFNTTDGGLIFKEQYIELSTDLPHEANIYGLGEVVTSFRRDSKYSKTTIWSRDAPDPPEENVYGSQPFYIEIRDGKAHGVFFVSSVGMDVVMTPGKLTYKALGGIFEFYIFLGPTPQDVLRQYAEVVGKPALMPSWSFGWHQSRWGYSTIEEVESVVAAYNRSHIPLEAMWTDIDYMHGYRDFSYDPRRFAVPKMRAFSDRLKKNNQKFVAIVDPGIKIDKGYPAYDTGMDAGIFISNPRSDGKPFIGKVWPDYTHFPDWFNPATQEWWTSMFEEWFKMVKVDGIWIDMNEIANFCDEGDCFAPSPDQRARLPTINWSKYQGVGNYWQTFNPHWPKYKIDNGGRGQSLPLHFRTAPMDAVHYNGTLEYFVHNLYGHMEGEHTYNTLITLRPTERPFILSRSTFAGSGRYMAHWLGDNWSTWESMRYSLTGLLSFTSVFGVPMVGADICGFIGNTDEELCRRWTQLGAVVYPFARNHNINEARSQEPYLWPSVAEASRKYIGLRYQLLPYWYTLFWRAHEFGESHVVRPLAWEYCDPHSSHSSPYDASQVNYIDRQVLVGPALLVTPVLEPGAEVVRGFFPKGVWYDYESGKVEFDNVNAGLWHEISAPSNHIPIHLRGGFVIPLHNSPAYHNTKDIWDDGRFGLVAGLDPYLLPPNARGASPVASGELYLDSEAGLSLSQESLTANSRHSFTISVEQSTPRKYQTPDGRWMQVPVYNIWFESKMSSIDLKSTDLVKNGTIDRIRLFGLPLVIRQMDSFSDDVPRKLVLQDDMQISQQPESFEMNVLSAETESGVELEGLSYSVQNYGVLDMNWHPHEGISLGESWKMFLAVSGRPRPVN